MKKEPIKLTLTLRDVSALDIVRQDHQPFRLIDLISSKSVSSGSIASKVSRNRFKRCFK